MSIRRPLIVALSGLALAMPAPYAAAQHAVTDSPRAARASETRSAAPVRLLDVEFGGGTLAAFVEAVRSAADPEPVNVVLLGSAGSLSVPAVSLRRVTAEAAFNAVCPRSLADVNTMSSGGEAIITIEANETLPEYERRRMEAMGREDSFKTAQAGGRAAQSAQQPMSLRVYSVREVIDDQSVTYSIVLDALKTALAADDKDAKAEVLHHESSGVLIVRGTNAQQNVAEQVLAAIRQDAQAASGASDRARQERELVLQRLVDAEMQSRRAEVEFAAAAQKLEHTQKLSEGGFATEQDVLDARRSFELAQLTRDQRAQQLQHLQVQRHALEAQAHESKPVQSRSVRFQTARPEIAAKLFHVLNELMGSVGSRGSVEVTGLSSASRGSEGVVEIEFTGPAEAMSHFQALCNLVKDLERAGD